jgi:hypothetical protein
MNVGIVKHYATPPTQPGIMRHFSFARQGDHDPIPYVSSL